MEYWDTHVHLDLTEGLLPQSVVAARIEWPIEKLEKYLKWYKRLPFIVHFILWAYNLVAKDFHIRAFLYYYGSTAPISHAKKVMASAGITRGVCLGVPYGAETSIERLAYLERARKQGFIVAMPARFKKGDCIVKGYPSVKGTPGLAELVSQNTDILIVHCNPGGIGEYKERLDPKLARDALLENENIRIVYAHGGWGRKEWRDEIEFQMLEFRFPDGSPRVFACCAFHDYAEPGYWTEFLDAVQRNPDCWLWGSDYPLSLFRDGAYKKRVLAYMKNLPKEIWMMIASFNPEALYGRWK